MSNWSADGAKRAADVVMRAVGGGVVKVRMPAPAVAGSDAEQLGLGTPLFQDAEIEPAMFRKLGTETVLLVSGLAMEAVVTTLAMNSVEALLESAAGVLVGDVLYEITNCAAERAAGVPVAWRVGLVKPTW
jgi:hypothetical protein